MDETFDVRLRRIEDQIAIYQILSAYNAAADSSDFELMCELWHEDCEYHIPPPADLEPAGQRPPYGVSHGHAGLREVMTCEYAQIVAANGSGHINSLPHVNIDGDLASATSYQKLFLAKDGRYVLERLSAARWEFIRTKDGWWISKRTSESAQFRCAGFAPTCEGCSLSIVGKIRPPVTPDR
jgi:hypothetical protein